MDPSFKKKARRVVSDDSASGPRSSCLVKTSAQRLNASLQQLEALHKSSGADSNLRIPSGKRIKLSHDTANNDTQPASVTKKKRPKFDLEFSALADDDATSSMYFFDETDSDEVPEPYELVRASVRSVGEAAGSLASLPSDYSDSGMDALIREAHPSVITPAETDIVKTQDVSTLQPIQSTLARNGSTHGDPTAAQATVASPLFRPQVRMHLRQVPALIHD
jgi:hypothetical protein